MTEPAKDIGEVAARIAAQEAERKDKGSDTKPGAGGAETDKPAESATDKPATSKEGEPSDNGRSVDGSEPRISGDVRPDTPELAVTTLKPAVKLPDGTVKAGELADRHDDILKQESVEPGTGNVERGFVDESGVFLTRGEAMAHVEENAPAVHDELVKAGVSELHSEDLQNAVQEVQNVEAEKAKVSKKGRKAKAPAVVGAVEPVPASEHTKEPKQPAGVEPVQAGAGKVDQPGGSGENVPADETGRAEPENAGHTQQDDAGAVAAVPEGAGTTSDRRTEPRGEDRRQDVTTRKKISEMTLEEAHKELLTNQLTDMPNRRAYEDNERLGHHAAIDADSLKWVNDNMGHESGDALLKAVGQAIKEETGQGYHFSGDEFVVEGRDEKHVNEIMGKVNDRLKKAELVYTAPDGTIYRKTGLEATHGTGSTLEEADTALRQRKTEREAAGERAARGEQPPGVVIETPERGAAGGEVAEVGAGGPAPVKPGLDYSKVHPKAQAKFEAALADKDTAALNDWLHLDNLALRAEFERRTGVKLPKTVKGTRAAVDEYFGTAKAEGVKREVPTFKTGKPVTFGYIQVCPIAAGCGS